MLASFVQNVMVMKPSILFYFFSVANGAFSNCVLMRRYFFVLCHKFVVNFLCVCGGVGWFKISTFLFGLELSFTTGISYPNDGFFSFLKYDFRRVVQCQLFVVFPTSHTNIPFGFQYFIFSV